MRTMEALCRKLVKLYALALDLPESYFDACFAEPHMILRMSRYPAIDGADETRREPGAAHRLRVHDPAAAQQGAGPVDPAARRPLDGRAGRRGRLRGQRRRHPAPLDQRALPVDAAPRAQRLGPAALRHPVLLRSRPRHDDRVPAVLPVGRSGRRSIRRSSSATTRCGSPPSATSTWPRWQTPSEADVAPGARATARWKS